MNLTLQRTDYRKDGIFGVLTKDDNDQIAVTLEHSYLTVPSTRDTPAVYAPKIPAGTYTCRRGQHQLEGMTKPFITFQVMDVPNHTNILLHVGNYNKDSDGCILLGRRIQPSDIKAGDQMITASGTTFDQFMDFQTGVDDFTITVKDQA